MSTTLIPVDPAATPLRSSRLLTISASLLPEEITIARRARKARNWVIVALVLAACVCAAWFAYAYHDKQQAEEELTEATNTVIRLQHDQRGFAETVRVQSDTTLLGQQLKTAMGKDLDWAAMLNTLRTAGIPSGVKVTGVNGTLDREGAEASKAKSMPGASTVTTVGGVVVTGTAPDKKAVASYVDALGKQTVLSNPYVTSVASMDDGGVSFSLKAGITNNALCGRFTTTCKSTGGN